MEQSNEIKKLETLLTKECLNEDVKESVKKRLELLKDKMEVIK